MTEPVSDDDLPAEDVYDPTGLELASEIAHQTARTSPLLPEVPALPPKIPKRRRWAGEQRSGAHPDDRLRVAVVGMGTGTLFPGPVTAL